MRLCGKKDRYKPVHEPTDGWMAERPTTGQRALRLDKGKWVLVPPASRRTTTVLKSLVSRCSVVPQLPPAHIRAMPAYMS